MSVKKTANVLKKECEFCAGSGQVSYFKGVSRFLLSVEDCPECCGLGFIVSGDENETKKDSDQLNTPRRKNNLKL